MLLICPKSWWRSSFEIAEPSTGIRFQLTMRSFKEGSSFVLDGDRYRLRRERWWGGAFVLECEGQELLRARKPSAFKRSLELNHGGERYRIAPRSMWSRKYELRQGDRVLGRIGQTSWWSRRAEADLPEDLPLVVRAFMVSLVLLMWRREKGAAASGAS